MKGYPFIWNGVASELYGVSIISINNNSWERPSGGQSEFLTDTVANNAQVMFLGSKQSPVLSFTLEFACEDSMDIYKYNRIKDWLFGEMEFRRLQICEKHFDAFYFNCQLKPDKDYLLNGFMGFSCNVTCDSPFAWENVRKRRIPHNGANFSEYSFHNLSADSDDMKPVITFKVGTNGKFKIINKSYNNLTFEWSDLQPDEIITCDCKNGIITSSLGLKRLSNFNKTFFKLKKGLNQLEFWYNATDVMFEYKNAVRLGGGIY